MQSLTIHMMGTYTFDPRNIVTKNIFIDQNTIVQNENNKHQ